MKLELVTHPNKILKTKCEKVQLDDPVEMWAKAMADVMGNALGLAANQVGIPKQLFIMQAGGKARVVLNPQIVERSDTTAVFIEGCLSFPGKKVRTRRPAAIHVHYQNNRFEDVWERLVGEEAVCFQHEYDHLQGKTMHDREFMGRY